MSFVYDSSLLSNELRLLQPLGCSGDVLRFRTQRVQRAYAPSYTAVSYTWGDQDASEVIYLDNRRFYVRPNLWSCLYYLADATRNAEWNYLWVDAICINQKSDAERNSQVRLMDQTYRDADCVSVWLGHVPLPEWMTFDPPTQTPTKRIEVDGFDWADAIINLSSRPYWSRVWVIQEFLLGRSVQLHCSNNQIDWSDFQSILSREAGINECYDAFDDVPQGEQPDLFAALSLVMGRHVDKHPETLQPLYDLLIDHYKSNCKDPRDKVFALLGLIEDEERQSLNKFFPDYSITEDHVAIITLAHLTQFPTVSRMQRKGEKITPDSEELFLGLGVRSKSRRRRLLRQAGRLDYLGCESAGQIVEFLTFDNPMEEDKVEDTVEHLGMGGTEGRIASDEMPPESFTDFLSTLFGGWLFAKHT